MLSFTSTWPSITLYMSAAQIVSKSSWIVLLSICIYPRAEASAIQGPWSLVLLWPPPLICDESFPQRKGWRGLSQRDWKRVACGCECIFPVVWQFTSLTTIYKLNKCLYLMQTSQDLPRISRGMGVEKCCIPLRLAM